MLETCIFSTVTVDVAEEAKLVMTIRLKLKMRSILKQMTKKLQE